MIISYSFMKVEEEVNKNDLYSRNYSIDSIDRSNTLKIVNERHSSMYKTESYYELT
jgi:hypothetical protein